MYDRGRAKEYRVAKKLRDEGWLVIRSAGSHSPIDLIAIKAPQSSSSGGNIEIIPIGEIRFIQVKSGKTQEREKNKALEGIKKYGRLYMGSARVL